MQSRKSSIKVSSAVGSQIERGLPSFVTTKIPSASSSFMTSPDLAARSRVATIFMEAICCRDVATSRRFIFEIVKLASARRWNFRLQTGCFEILSRVPFFSLALKMPYPIPLASTQTMRIYILPTT